MRRKENLEWSKHTDQLIRFVDLGGTDLNRATLDKTDITTLAFLVFLTKNIASLFKINLANFVNTNATPCQLFTLI